MELYELSFYLLILSAIITVMLRLFCTIHNNKK